MRFVQTTVSRFRCLMLLVAVVAGAGCSSKRGEPDARCNLDNCRKLHECRVLFEAEPNFSVCFKAGLSAPSGFDFALDCPAACEAQGGGRLVECVAQQPTCDGLSSENMLGTVTSCQSSGSGGFSTGPDASGADEHSRCEATCESTRTTCENACPTGDFQSCSDCARACAKTFGECDVACN